MNKLFPVLAAGLLFLGAGCAPVADQPVSMDEETQGIAVGEPNPSVPLDVRQGVSVMETAMVRIPLAAELFTEATMRDGQLWFGRISNRDLGVSEDTALRSDDFVVAVKVAREGQSVTREDFETMYTNITPSFVWHGREVVKGSTPPVQGATVQKVGYFRASEDGDAVMVTIDVGSDQGLQNAESALEQLEWMK